FLADHAEGRGDRWYYADLAQLVALPPPRAAAHLLAGSPERAAAVVLQLDREGALDRVLRGATTLDVDDLWRAPGLPAADPPDLAAASDPGVLDALAPGLADVAGPAAPGAAPFRLVALRLAVTGLRSGVPTPERRSLAHAAVALARLAELAAALPAGAG